MDYETQPIKEYSQSYNLKIFINFDSQFFYYILSIISRTFVSNYRLPFVWLFSKSRFGKPLTDQMRVESNLFHTLKARILMCS